jgi:hypothetical protein
VSFGVQVINRSSVVSRRRTQPPVDIYPPLEYHAGGCREDKTCTRNGSQVIPGTVLNLPGNQNGLRGEPRHFVHVGNVGFSYDNNQ